MEAKIGDFHQTRSTLLICQRSISHHKRKLNILFKKLVPLDQIEQFKNALGIEKLNYAKFPAGTKQAVQLLQLILTKQDSIYSKKYANIKFDCCIFDKEDYNHDHTDNESSSNHTSKIKQDKNNNTSSLFIPHSNNCATCIDMRAKNNLYLEMNSTIYAFHDEKIIAGHRFTANDNNNTNNLNNNENLIDTTPAMFGPNGEMYETRIIKMEGDAIKPAKVAKKRGKPKGKNKKMEQSTPSSNDSVVKRQKKKKGKKRKLSQENYNDRNQRRKLNQPINNSDFYINNNNININNNNNNNID